ncbi:polysaccharide pyruvyl transferase family protein [Nitrincola iocasae]|uniref:Polysaccharide pyruvyl transferase family protein n=1 Tax=Nitrincola iocasae TaxID=2614693 RepID=A0A5J6LCU8_9GAMM|nr:polysaccharide pyruvyl transferase family protein [Nitrincola iocasae]QEW06256.1 polysaccharide pyruvyl transferase family protein [Nitrincola iocasae]
MRSITACGSFGFHNIGDEIISFALKNMFDEINCAVDLNILSRFDSPDLEGVIGLLDHDKLQHISHNPIIMIGGGMVENKKSCVMLRLYDYINKVHKSKIGFLGISVEPGIQYNLRNKFLLKRMMNKSTTGCVYTRDYFSEAVLRRNIKRINVETVGDIALWSYPSTMLPNDLILPDSYIAISLCNTWKDNESWYKWISMEVKKIHSETGLDIVFVPMSSKFDDDRVTHKIVADLIKDNEYIHCIEHHLHPTELVKIYSMASLVIASRLHSCVLAYSQKVPFVGISYHPKLVGFSHTIGCRDFVLPRSIPDSQTDGYYGYSFENLNVKSGDLVDLALKSISDFDFKSLEVYKNKSLTALKKMISSFEI